MAICALIRLHKSLNALKEMLCFKKEEPRTQKSCLENSYDVVGQDMFGLLTNAFHRKYASVFQLTQQHPAKNYGYLVSYVISKEFNLLLTSQ